MIPEIVSKLLFGAESVYKSFEEPLDTRWCLSKGVAVAGFVPELLDGSLHGLGRDVVIQKFYAQRLQSILRCLEFACSALSLAFELDQPIFDLLTRVQQLVRLALGVDGHFLEMSGVVFSPSSPLVTAQHILFE